MSTLPLLLSLLPTQDEPEKPSMFSSGLPSSWPPAATFPLATAANQSTPETFFLVIKLSHSSACLEGISAQCK